MLKQYLFFLIFLNLSSNLSSFNCPKDPICNKKLIDVMFPLAHNAYSSEAKGFFPPDNKVNMTMQMQKGIRGLMLDAHYYKKSTYLCHGSCAAGNQSLFDGLMEIKIFLDSHPNEIITIMFESYITSSDINRIFQEIGLDNNAYVYHEDSGWPTIGDMLTLGKNLLVMADKYQYDYNYGSRPDWLHDTKHIAIGTPWFNKSTADFTCETEIIKENPHKLFILSHYIYAPIYTLEKTSEPINRNPYLTERILRCIKETGRKPNYIALSFATKSDVVNTTIQLNVSNIEDLLDD